ncbi:MAG: hypothetical protein QUU85_06365, partial [Candidatus Eisenbacteria bacterium]|nr:hypothetical protein [Candidatus Eisenbacteria bacterium]
MMMRTRPSRLRILSRLRLLAVLVLPLALLVLPATRSVADPAGDSPLGPLDAARIGTTMQSHDAAIAVSYTHLTL